eukprot:scaffold240593_cov32-Prasinocladus_malaysianus.AAC.1
MIYTTGHGRMCARTDWLGDRLHQKRLCAHLDVITKVREALVELDGDEVERFQAVFDQQVCQRVPPVVAKVGSDVRRAHLALKLVLPVGVGKQQTAGE